MSSARIFDLELAIAAVALAASGACAVPTQPVVTSPPSSSAPRERGPVISWVGRPVEPARSKPWRSFEGWARKTARAASDDLDCSQKIRKQATEAPDGAQSFALLMECARADKLQDLRIPFTRPWRTHLLELDSQTAAELLGQIVAARGALVENDVRFCQERGVFVHSLREVEFWNDEPEPRFVLIRGVVGNRRASPRGEQVELQETAAADVLVRRRTYYGHRYYELQKKQPSGLVTTGRTLPGVARKPLLNTSETTEQLFLVRVRMTRVPDASEPRKETEVLHAWPVGVRLPELRDVVRDRGVDAEDLSVERFVLENGLTVIFHEDHRLPIAHVNVTYRVGAFHEEPNRSGFAHLFEHMMFQGSAHVERGQHAALLEARGAYGVNAFTTFDRTIYLQTVPRHELETALWLEADRMGFLPHRVDVDALENQKRVVQNERRERTEDALYGPADELILKTLFPPGHPYRHGVIGAPEDIDAATLTDVLAFFRDFYSPRNATLVVAGDFTPELARSWVERYFATLPDRPVRSVNVPHSFGLKEAVTTQVSVPLARYPRVSMVWAGPAAYAPGAAELDAYAHLLGPQGANVLAQELRTLEVDLRDVQVRFHETLAGSWFEIQLVVGGGVKSLEEVVIWVDRVLAPHQRGILLDEDLAGIARSMERSVLFELQTLARRSALLATHDHLFADPRRLRWELERVQAVTPGGMQAAVHSFLGGVRLVVFATPDSQVAAR